MSERPVLAIVDDETDFRTFVRDVAESSGWRAEEMAKGSDLRKALDAGLKPALVIIDVMMPEEDGIELIRSLAAYSIDMKIQILTGGPLLYADAMRMTAKNPKIEFCEPLQKPVRVSKLREILGAISAQLPS